MNDLFTIKLQVGDESFSCGYGSIDQCLNDDPLFGMLERDGASCSVWSGDTRITRDIETASELKRQIVSNASTLLRGME